MANKADRQYFENFTAAADYTCQASRYLVECLNNFDLDNIKAMLETMHEFEHKGDDKHHEMSGMLAKAFVTPVDREDLAMISQSIDEVLDKLEEVLQRFYVDQIRVIIPDAITFASKLQNCCELLKGIMEEFINFKKPVVTYYSMNQIKEKTGITPSITTLFEDQDGNLWFNQNRYGLCLWNMQTDTLTLYQEIPSIKNLPGLSPINCISGFRSLPGEVWVGSGLNQCIYVLGKKDNNIVLLYTIDLSNVSASPCGAPIFFFEDFSTF